MTNQITIGIIACGPRGVQMAQICRLLPKYFRLTAVSDPDPRKLQVMKTRFPDIGRFYESSEELLETSGVQAVIVETPPELHTKYVIMALERGIHVMGEIPSVNTYDEAMELWNIVNKHPEVLYSCGATANYRQKTRMLQYLRNRGLVGKMVYAETEYNHGMEKPYQPPEDAASQWRNNYDACRYCTHSLGPLLDIMDEDDEFTTVSCMGTGKHFPAAWKDHAMVSILRTKKNAVVRFLAAFGLYRTGPYHTTRIYTDKGQFELYNESVKIFNPDFTDFCEHPQLIEVPFGRFPRRFLEEFSMDEVLAGEGGHGGADFYMLEEFADAIVTGKKSPVPIKKGLAMTLPGIFAAESAAEGGQLVTIRYPWN